MPKKKLKTPDWILQGYDSKKEWEKAQGIGKKKKKGKTFKIKKCPKCKSDNVKVVVGEENKNGYWKCGDCSWTGKKPDVEELDENEFMEYLDDKGESVA